MLSLQTLVGHVPAPFVRVAGRVPGVDRLARKVLVGVVVIPRGAAAGLRLDATGQPPGFALGSWEPTVQEAFAGLLRPGQVVYDVGAAAGFYTLIAARTAGQVVAVEPLSANAERLRRNVALNGFENVTVLELALGETPGRAALVGQALQTQAVAGDEVELTTIDELAARLPLPDVVKVDVEGAELAVLRGARQTLIEYRPALLVELHREWVRVLALLEELGYDCRDVDPAHILATAH